MVFGKTSPRIKQIKTIIDLGEPLEVFPNVVINATEILKVTQQIHYIINRNRQGVFHLGSTDLVHQRDFIADVCEELGYRESFIQKCIRF